jgi:hypothetical protein
MVETVNQGIGSELNRHLIRYGGITKDSPTNIVPGKIPIG